MDYTREELRFRLKKALRYVGLYGLPRTLVKVKSQYHMKRRYETLPPLATTPAPGGHVGIIGCGNFAYSHVAYFLRRRYGRVIRGCMDIDLHRAASLYADYSLRYYTNDSERLIRDPEIDLIFIVSNHASHTDYAIRALAAGKSVHIEKPQSVDRDQLRRLCTAMIETRGKVTLGFNRPGSAIGREIRRHLDTQSGPSMLNWFVAGHDIPPGHWYLRPEEGGRILGNLCHWTDFVLRLVPAEARFPIVITPTSVPGSDRDVAVSFLFGDGSIASITFTSKGEPFEGVRERFAGQRGDALVFMEDFKELTLELADRKHRRSRRHRDHGHQAQIERSYGLVRGATAGEPVSHVWETGLLFLETRQAVERREPVRVEGFSESFGAAARRPELERYSKSPAARG